MDLSERKRFKASIKASHREFLKKLPENQRSIAKLESRFERLRKNLNNQLRKVDSSGNSVRLIPRLCRIVFGLQEDIKRLKLPFYEFCIEQDIINYYVIHFLTLQRETQYNGECQYYGETLLNLYLDIFITLTCWNTPRKIDHKPGYLKNPNSGQLLELDIVLEDFKLAFEFQGESHYRDKSDMEKDALKLKICSQNNVVLIPVNISQLDSQYLMDLIINSIKDALDLHEYLSKKNNPQKLSHGISGKNLLAFKKATQRIYLAKQILGNSIVWLDRYASRFRETQASRNPISASTEAPRILKKGKDFDVDYIYHRLMYL